MFLFKKKYIKKTFLGQKMLKDNDAMQILKHADNLKKKKKKKI